MGYQQVNFRREYRKPCRNNKGKTHQIKKKQGLQKDHAI